MSIQSEVSRLQSAKASLAAAIEAKGVSVPETTKLDGYSDLVEQIEAGGGGGGGSAGVQSLNGLAGALQILAGDNISVSASGSNITVSGNIFKDSRDDPATIHEPGIYSFYYNGSGKLPDGMAKAFLLIVGPKTFGQPALIVGFSNTSSKGTVVAFGIAQADWDTGEYADFDWYPAIS